MSAAQDLTNQRYGRLVVLKRVKNRGKCSAWECLCDCGKKGIWRGQELRSGKTASCGCLLQEYRRSLKTHGMSGTSEYKTWDTMIQRCTNPEDPAYKDYGARGITVAPRWRNSFSLFYKDMGPKPGPKYSIERDDVNAGYFKDNCRWATPKEQGRNRRNHLWVSYKGEQRILADVADELGLGQSYLRNYVLKSPNATIEEILARFPLAQ